MSLHLRRFGRSNHSNRHQAQPGDDGDHVLIAEATALVEGRAADLYEARGLPIPYWAWLNALAHRPPAAFRALVTAYSLGPWSQATIDMADELDRVGPADAEAIQAAVLVPAELAALSERSFEDRFSKPFRSRKRAPSCERDASAQALVRVVRRHVAQTRRHHIGQ